MALLELFLAAAWARVIAADVFQRVARRLLMGVIAVRSMHMAGVMAVIVRMIVVAVGAVDVRFLLHWVYSGM